MTALDFGGVPDVMAAGAHAARCRRHRLTELALPVALYSDYRSARASRGRRRGGDCVRAAGMGSDRDAARIEAVFGDLAGAPFDPQELQRRANRQYGLNRYESVDYRLVREGDRRGLQIDLRAKSWGPSFLRLGLGIESDYDEGSRANAAGEILMTGLNRLDGEWLTQLQLGEDPRFFTEWFQPLSLANDVFLAPSLRHEIASFRPGRGRLDDRTLSRARVGGCDRDRRRDLELGRGPARTAPRRRRGERADR